MQHFTENVVGKTVADAHGEELGRVTALDDGKAMLKPYTGVEAMEAEAVSGGDRLAIDPEQVVEVTESVVRVELD